MTPETETKIFQNRKVIKYKKIYFLVKYLFDFTEFVSVIRNI